VRSAGIIIARNTGLESWGGQLFGYRKHLKWATFILPFITSPQPLLLQIIYFNLEDLIAEGGIVTSIF